MSDHGWPGFWHFYETGGWEPHTRALLAEVLRPGDLFVDVGAWIGPVTLWALELGAQVVAVEPDPVALDELRRRAPGVEVRAGAVTATAGTALLAPNPKPGGELGDSMSRLGDHGVEVPTWTLPEILAGRRPALVKIDIEGGELDLLPELGPWLATQGAVLQVSCHGMIPDPESFAGYRSVAWPADLWGDVVARP